MSKIFDSLKVSKEVSDDVDETVKILDIIEKEKEYLEKTHTNEYFKININSVMKVLIINVAKTYKNL